ncbi:ATP-binding cassette domain-containing protein [Haloplasma contractile]|uniref:ABC transporter ATP-binding protein n=1 Tax=Haloplasma contractile SSD-17B TaxID=1033810 RepID=F7Q200_9MOLU|nr:ATP-binding cassette domain-containing protein [Haloplasma contractile]ERJ12192.1 ABC transporter ATP-binding protein [Haloplasma contractile SSD-17B]
MPSIKQLKELTINELFDKYPYSKDFMLDHHIPFEGKENLIVDEVLDTIDEEHAEDQAIDVEKFKEQLIEYINLMLSFLGEEDESQTEVTILPGFYKDGSRENYDRLTIKSGEIICIVGPTGSGKSRLLADIEWAANYDTPTKRTVLINGNTLDTKERFSSSNKLVAQLSQNMNFVMDLTVEEFLDLHATSRLVENKEDVIISIFNKANELAGEQFKLTTPITSLSGGQSRALMIADTAILSKSPIVLIDEIENAGIDREKALDLLVSEDKIVLMATHDPILALMGDKRIIINNGGIEKIVDTTEDELNILSKLKRLDRIMLTMRNKLRYGEQLEFEEEI